MDGLWGSGCRLGSKFRALFSPLNNLLGHPAHKDPLERVCGGETCLGTEGEKLKCQR